MLYCSWECSNDKVVRSCASIEPLKARCRQQGVFKIFQYTSIQYVFRLSPRFRDFWPFSGSSTMTHRWNALTVKFTTKSLGPRPDDFCPDFNFLCHCWNWIRFRKALESSPNLKFQSAFKLRSPYLTTLFPCSNSKTLTLKLILPQPSFWPKHRDRSLQNK